MVLHTLTSGRRWPRIALTAAGIAALVTTTAGWVASATGSHSIHACSANHGGALRIAKHCASNETAVSWNKVGPRGPAGVARGYVGRYLTVKSGGIQLGSANETITHTANLAAGAYLVSATVNLAMYSGTGTACRITSAMGNKSVGAQHAEAQTPPGSTGSNADLAMNTMIVHAAKGDSLRVICRDYHQGSKPTTVNNAEINVFEVSDLAIVSQTLKPRYQATHLGLSR